MIGALCYNFKPVGMKEIFQYRKIIYSAAVFILLAANSAFSQTQLDTLMDDAIEYAKIQLEKTIVEIAYDSTVHPSETVDSTHTWLVEGYKSWNSWWTSGYFSACYWYMYQLTNEEKWRNYAEKWTANLETMKSVEDFSNVSDIIYFSYGNGYKNTYNEQYAPILNEAADTYIKLYDPEVEAIKCWGGTWSGTRFAVVTDVLIDNEFLFLNYQLTGNQDYYNVVTDHINKTIDYNIREDGSCWQFVDFDIFGDPIGYNNTQAYQGAPTGARWTRAHAWAINGLTQAYRYTRRQKYLDAAIQIAEYFIDHLPDDFVPPSDFDVPLDAENGRDAAAAAIACSGLFELSQYAVGDKYRKYADSIMLSLCSPEYLSVGSDYSSILKRGQVRYTEPEKGLIYADAFFLEAILKYKGMYKYFIDGEGPINLKPVAKAGKDQTITDTDQDGVETILLDGSASRDPDDSIVLYEWLEDSLLMGTGAILADTLAVGTHQIILRVTDKYGETDADTVGITILADPTSYQNTFGGERYVEVFPNPADNGRLTIKTHGFVPAEKLHLEIFDLSGRLMVQNMVIIRSAEDQFLQVNTMHHGVCILKITGKDYVLNRKIIIR
jgi:unsaturated chondroitin disaccharide hydrolase